MTSNEEPATDYENAMRTVGEVIRKLRVAKELTLTDVAERTGLSISMLSMLERGKSGGSLGTLVAVASALGVTMSDLFATEQHAAPVVQRRGEQPRITLDSGPTRYVSHRDSAQGLEIATIEFPPGSHTGDDPVRHRGVEYLTVMSGALTVEIGGDSYELSTGDGLSLSAEVLHRFANNTEESATLVVVQCTTPIQPH
ncbi:helix-turn-helix domain-containing protein [Gordonia sp. NPDC003376]